MLLKDRFVKYYIDGIGLYLPIGKKSVLLFLMHKLLRFSFFLKKTYTFNFIVTSKTEIRIFTPLLEYVLENNPKININILFVSNNIYFDDVLQKKILRSKTIKLRDSAHYLLMSSINKRMVNVICLDHGYYEEPHKKGINIVDNLNKLKSKTVCIQHGGNQDDNILSQSTSKSKYQILFGVQIYYNLLNSNFSRRQLFLTGNPLHDKIANNELKWDFKENRRVISLVTCMHTEYDNIDESDNLYKLYLRKVYSSINFKKYVLVIKMHPYDSLSNNIYVRVKKNMKISSNNIIIFPSNNNLTNVYSLIKRSDLIISRASTVIEEALMLGKKVIAFDLFEDGPSICYDFLMKYENYIKVIGDENLLKKEIEISSSFGNDEIEEIIENLTYKLDGNSSYRVFKALRQISKEICD